MKNHSSRGVAGGFERRIALHRHNQVLRNSDEPKRVVTSLFSRASVYLHSLEYVRGCQRHHLSGFSCSCSDDCRPPWT